PGLRGSATHLYSSRHAEGRSDRHSRRGNVRYRPGKRVGHPVCTGKAGAGQDAAGHCPPAVHHCGRRSDHCCQSRQDRSDRHAGGASCVLPPLSNHVGGPHQRQRRRGGGVMLKTLKKFFAFCGVDNRRLFITSIWLGVVSAICSAMRIPAAAIVIQALLERNVTMATLWTSLGIIVISLIITIAINMKATMLQTRAGYRACANKRIEIAAHLRYLPMGWFNDNSHGEVTSVTTNTIENMANVATHDGMVTTRGFLNSGILPEII